MGYDLKRIEVIIQKVSKHKSMLLQTHRLRRRCFHISFLFHCFCRNTFNKKFFSLFISMLKFHPTPKGLRFDLIFVYTKCGCFQTNLNCSGQYSKRSYKIFSLFITLKKFNPSFRTHPCHSDNDSYKLRYSIPEDAFIPVSAFLGKCFFGRRHLVNANQWKIKLFDPPYKPTQRSLSFICHTT